MKFKNPIPSQTITGLEPCNPELKAEIDTLHSRIRELELVAHEAKDTLDCYTVFDGVIPEQMDNLKEALQSAGYGA